MLAYMLALVLVFARTACGVPTVRSDTTDNAGDIPGQPPAGTRGDLFPYPGQNIVLNCGADRPSQDEWQQLNDKLDQLTNAVNSCRASDGEDPEAPHPRDCQDILDNDETTPSGVYTVYPRDGLGGVMVYCDNDIDGGGWTVFQKRQDGSVDFYRGWRDYQAGFPSNLNGEFWLGLDKLYRLAVQKTYQLRVDMWDAEGNARYAAYNTFAISPESQNYKLHIGTYSGNARDSLAYHNGHPFSTKDRDNDASTLSCAQTYKGAWWYTACHHSNLNGLYHLGPHASYADGVNWNGWKGYKYSLKRTEMKFKPIA
ncbi:microfibril-associated glycoprotein 4-like [Branchiostoma floridae]|uniref:Microfibril-associated glycoprotein 4-like n=1 Tax=Branchiostoma floridae TaxID=7739 RepID=A0A9J7M5V3_BRAFL|nr:microfibril-associated glycoprotein 4-like [Branchiostoma floridae]